MTHSDDARLPCRSRHTRSRRWLVVAAASLLVVGGACAGSDDGSSERPDVESTTLPPASQHFDSDLAQVCRGTGVEWAAPYDPTTTGPHKVVVFQGSDETDLTSVATGNAEWDVVFEEASDAYAAVELVACAVRISDELAQTCTGYKDDDGTATGKTVEYHSATYAITLRAANTAETIDETTVDAAADDCPMLVYFDEGETTLTQYANVDANAFLLPHATT